MSRHLVLLFILLLLMTGTSCFESGGGSVCVLEGPSEMDEGSTASFAVSVVGQDAESYDWMIDPPIAGTFDNPHTPEIKLHAGPLTSTGDLKATIGVAVTLRTGVVYKNKKIIIKYVAANHSLELTAAAHSDFTAIEPGGTVHFFDDSVYSVGGPEIVKWEWDFSYNPLEGFVSEREDQNPTHVFEDKGLYLVQLRVTDSTGLSDMLDDPIEIAVTDGNIAPIAQAHAQSTVAVEGASIQFFDDSIDANGQPDILKWDWDFSYVPSDGFNTESQDQNPVVQFPDIGTFEVQLRVTDTSGLSDMLDTPIKIQVVASNSPPIAQAHTLSTAVNEGAYIKFIDDSTDADGLSDIVKREWDFSYVESDGFHTESQEQNPVVQFPTVGTFAVQLRVTDTNGLSDMLDNPLQISVLRPGWAVSWGSEKADATATLVAVDKDRNTYVAGTASEWVDFDPGPGVLKLDMESYGSYISKFDPNGNFHWAVGVTGVVVQLCAGDFDGVSFAVEYGDWAVTAGIGHVSSSGQWSGQWQTIGQGIWTEDYYTFAHESFNVIDMFVDSSLNTSVALYHMQEEGFFTWDGDPPEPWPYVTDSSENYSIIKYSWSGKKFWETSYGYEDVVSIADRHDGTIVAVNKPGGWGMNYALVRLDSSGNTLWNYIFPSEIIINSVSCDSNSNTFYLGESSPSGDLDPGPGSFCVTENEGMFLCKLDSNMQLVWGREWSPKMTAGHAEYGWPPMVAADSSGNTFLTGLFAGGVDVDPGPGISWFSTYHPNTKDVYIIVLDPEGAFKWAALFTTFYAFNEHALDVAKVAPDSQGCAHLAGYFWHCMDFDPGVGLDIRYSPGVKPYHVSGFLTKVTPGDIW
jgi:PKD repeat protein